MEGVARWSEMKAWTHRNHVVSEQQAGDLADPARVRGADDRLGQQLDSGVAHAQVVEVDVSIALRVYLRVRG